VSGLPGRNQGFQLIVRRIKYLVGSGALIAQGDFSRPRYSEVRLPSQNDYNIAAKQAAPENPGQGHGERGMSDYAQWITAATVLVQNSSAKVQCPKCGVAILMAEVEELDRTHFDLHLRCSECGAHETVYKRRD